MTDLIIKYDREEDGRWIATIPECYGFAGVAAYGASREEARIEVQIVALQAVVGAGVLENVSFIDEEKYREPSSYAPREVAEAFSLYLNSGAAMALFSKLLLYRASGDNARVVVKYAGKNYRVSIHRTNGEVEHFNRDGKE